jgi:uncharacterized membrane protein YeaQ/YmgE (transglycosylase-associated protein family)
MAEIMGNTALVTAVAAVVFAGVAAGWLGGLVTRGSGLGLRGNILLAWPGALAGVYIGGWLGLGAASSFTALFFAALLGAFGLLYIVAGFRR